MTMLIVLSLLLTTTMMMMLANCTKVHLSGGAVVTGIDEDTYTIYHGIPYARRPARWTRSQPIQEYGEGEVIDGTTFGRQCFQTGKQISPYQSIYLDLKDAGEFEDCLNVTIYAPKVVLEGEGESKSLPVLVWLYGGNFANGGNSQANMDMRTLMDENPGMLIAVPNYRVGPLGFFALPADEDDNDEDDKGEQETPLRRRRRQIPIPGRDRVVEGNQGITDIVSALRWVQMHIGAFGGDPSNVTAMGHSAGAYAIQYISALLATSPFYGDLGNPVLFHRVILHSGTVQTLPLRTLTEAETEGMRLAKELGCLMPTVKATRACMMLKSADQISAKAANLEWKRIWTPTVGHPDFAPSAPLRVLEEGRAGITRLPTLLMTVEDDGSFFIPKDLQEDKFENYKPLVYGFFNPKAAPAIAAQYGLGRYGNSFRTAATRILSDMLFHAPARRYAAALAALGNPKVWFVMHSAEYSVNTYLEPKLPGQEHLGAFHGSDHVLMLAPPVSDPRIPENLADIPASRELRRRITQFVTLGTVEECNGSNGGWATPADQLIPTAQDELWRSFEDLPTNNVIALLRLDKLKQ